MTLADFAGTGFIAAMIGLLGYALIRMRPAWPFVALALVLGLADGGLRLAAGQRFEAAITATGAVSTARLVHARNPAGRDEADLTWPNQVVIFLVTALAIWLSYRPHSGAPWVGVGLALIVPGASLNLAEPLLLGYTTDYLPIGDLILNLADVALIVGLAVTLIGVVAAERAARAV